MFRRGASHAPDLDEFRTVLVKLYGAIAVTLRPDDEWRTSMTSADRLIVTAMTAPLLMRYGYSLAP